ncbi:MAG: Na+ dependent nucleoside transporter [Bacteroidetes bacterium]|nr:Na+ dependent nucleoside transporter [Bacteroidota bacterium]MDA0950661.1 Na+ dependent nucleoside transporter [Bacteroidota bacterium]
MAILRGLIGITVLLAIAYLLSSKRTAVRWKTVFIGLALQFTLAFGVLRIEWVKQVFNVMGGFFTAILEFTESGSLFLFGNLIDASNPAIGYVFALQILPTIVFFSALTSILYYFGIIQRVVKALAWLLTKALGISGAESLSVAGNIFLGQTEAPLLIKAYLPKMNRSEILLVMTGGMATVAGGVLASYVSFLGGSDPELRLSFARHLIAASVMAAPGAILISKLMLPQTKVVDEAIEISDTSSGSNALDALANGTTEGLKLALNVGAMLLVFIAFIALINGVLNQLGTIGGLNDFLAPLWGYEKVSLEAILGTLFAPLMYIIGVAKEDLSLMGQLLGIKLVASEFVAYTQLASLKDMNNTVHLAYDKSVLMATYMLCGFANFASIGIQIGGIGTLAPSQKKTLSELGFKALIAGSLASLLSATIAGMILG